MRNNPQTKPSALLQSVPPARRPFQQLGMDFLGPLTQSSDGNRHVIVLIDYHTKRAVTVAVPEATAANAAKAFLEAIVHRHGALEQVITDRGQHFLADMMAVPCHSHETHAHNGYHPQTTGLCERFNQTLAEMISQYVSSDHRDWDPFLPFVTFTYN